jgi:hypothetical protein
MFENSSEAIKLTVIVMISLIAIIAIYDIWVYVYYGSNATISRILLKSAQKAPIIGVAFGIAIGTLLGHLFWPQRIKDNKDLTSSKEDDNIK